MPWEKQFEREDVLEKAMQAFWQHGYDGTSMKDLISCMGLNPGSIYATFGDKKNLYRLALEHYEGQADAQFAGYEANYSPRNAILAVFKKLVSDAQSGSQNSACFLVNSVVDAAPKDASIERVVESGLAGFETFLQKMIKAGQDLGEISWGLDAVKTARVLMGLVIGGRILARGHLDSAALEDFVQQADRLLG